MSEIKTFVFLDLETTGILEHDIKNTRITELSLIAVHREHLLSTRKGLMPRVQNKITLCIYPRMMISPSCAKETGLCNDLLEHESIFNKNVYTLLKHFLSKLSAPKCLIAHNGFRFDFPIIKTQLEKLGVTISEDILFSDSLKAFREITKMESGGEEIEKDIQNINETTPVKQVIKNKTKSKSSIKTQRGLIGHKTKPYRLQNLYKTLLEGKSPRKAHRAENDCLMLLECAVMQAEDFVKWVDKNNRKFSDIKPMSSEIRKSQKIRSNSK